jgi:hypothetical protein
MIVRIHEGGLARQDIFSFNLFGFTSTCTYQSETKQCCGAGVETGAANRRIISIEQKPYLNAVPDSYNEFGGKNLKVCKIITSSHFKPYIKQKNNS